VENELLTHSSSERYSSRMYELDLTLFQLPKPQSQQQARTTRPLQPSTAPVDAYEKLYVARAKEKWDPFGIGMPKEDELPLVMDRY